MLHLTRCPSSYTRWFTSLEGFSAVKIKVSFRRTHYCSRNTGNKLVHIAYLRQVSREYFVFSKAASCLFQHKNQTFLQILHVHLFKKGVVWLVSALRNRNPWNMFYLTPQQRDGRARHSTVSKRSDTHTHTGLRIWNDPRARGGTCTDAWSCFSDRRMLPRLREGWKYER